MLTQAEWSGYDDMKDGGVASQTLASALQASTPSCLACGTTHVGLQLCSKCLVARFCSKECIAAAWPTHKHDCKALRRQAQGQ